MIRYDFYLNLYFHFLNLFIKNLFYNIKIIIKKGLKYLFFIYSFYIKKI